MYVRAVTQARLDIETRTVPSNLPNGRKWQQIRVPVTNQLVTDWIHQLYTVIFQ
jgi:hypothetical protein